MLLFGHTGITVGIVKACGILGSTSSPSNSYEPDSSSRFSLTAPKKWPPLYRLLNRIRRQLGSIDYRIVLLGSLLPDIPDKLAWLFAFSDISPRGRTYGHTFLFNLVLLICGLILVRYRKSWLLVISLCSFIHLILDQMWDMPVVLWWPLLGPFQRMEPTGWLSNIIQQYTHPIHALSSDPGTYIPEVIGLIIILALGYRLIVRKRMVNFIRTGAID